MNAELLLPQGAGPHALPEVQSVRVDFGPNEVRLVAFCVPPAGKEKFQITIPMTATVAQSLLGQLPRAIEAARITWNEGGRR
jgi:hypothetical protein